MHLIRLRGTLRVNMTAATPIYRDKALALPALRRARALLADPHRWTKGYLARDKRAAPISPFDEDACRFCLLGAVWRACPSKGESYGAGSLVDSAETEAVEAALRLTLVDKWRELNNSWISGKLDDFNDSDCTRHADIIKLLDLTIAACEGD